MSDEREFLNIEAQCGFRLLSHLQLLRRVVSLAQVHVGKDRVKGRSPSKKEKVIYVSGSITMVMQGSVYLAEIGVSPLGKLLIRMQPSLDEKESSFGSP
mgnify:CR=1 FL=1